MTTMTAGVVPEWTTGDKLRKAREITGLDRKAFAADLRIGRNSVQKYEEDGEIPRTVLLAWAMRTGVSMEWLGDGAPGPECPRLDSNQRPSAYMVEGSPFLYLAAA